MARICGGARFLTVRRRWRGCCAIPRPESCSTNTSPGMALQCSHTLADLARRALSPRRSTAPIDPVHARCGLRSAIPQALRCSGSGVRGGTGEGCPALPSRWRWLSSARHRCQRPRHGVACQSRSRPGWKFRILMKALLFNILQFGNLARHLLLAGGELIHVAHHPFLAGRELVDVARYLLLSDGDPVDVLPHSVETELLRIGRRGARRNWRGPRRQPAKLRV